MFSNNDEHEAELNTKNFAPDYTSQQMPCESSNQPFDDFHIPSINTFNFDDWDQSFLDMPENQGEKKPNDPLFELENQFSSIDNQLFDDEQMLIYNNNNSEKMAEKKDSTKGFAQNVIKNNNLDDEVNSSPQILVKPSNQIIKQIISLQSFPFSFFLSEALQKNKQLKKVSKRTNFTKDQKEILINFIEKHKEKPYIDNHSLTIISKQTGLTDRQIRIFLTNYRVRNDLSQKRKPKRTNRIFF